jgi:hypothetical protein
MEIINSILKKIMVIAMTMTFGVVLNAQEGTGLESDNQEIIKSFEATLEDAEKVKIVPKVEPVVPSKKVYNYKLTILPLEVTYPAPIIKPLAAEPDEPFTSKNFYAKLGYGNVANPHAVVKFHTSDEDKFGFYANVSYDGLDNGKKIANQKMAELDLNTGINYKLNESHYIDIKANVGFDKRNIYFIGTNSGPTEFLGKARNTIQFGGRAEIYNLFQKDEGIHYKGTVDYNILNNQLPNTTENVFMVKAEVGKQYKNWLLNIPVQFNANLKNNTKDLYAINFRPSLKFNSEAMWLKLGAAIHNDASLKTKIWPVAQLEYKLSENGLSIFLGTDQVSYTNNLHNLLSLNPWMDNRFDTLTTHIAHQASGGIKTTAKAMSFQLEGGYAFNYNLATFTNLNNPALANVRPINVNNVFVRGNIELAIKNNFAIGGNLLKNFYSKDVYGVNSLELKAYGKLGFFKNRINLTPSLLISDRTTALTKIGDVNLSNQAALNLGLNINFTEKFGLYIDGLNVLDNKYAMFYGYPVTGIHFNGGVTLRM